MAKFELKLPKMGESVAEYGNQLVKKRRRHYRGR